MVRRAIASLFLVAICGVACAATNRPPNVVLILADDLGPGPVGAYGNPYAKTPAIDQLARDGMLFSAAYAAGAVCSPTRATLMTGKSPARSRITDFIPGHPFPYARLLQPKWRKALKDKVLPEFLADHGYTTGLFGKWHLAGGSAVPRGMRNDGGGRYGFQETFLTQKPDEHADPEADAHGVNAIKTRALDFIQRHRDEPFFLFVAPNTIHSPLMAPAALVEKHRRRPGADAPENNPTIAAMMEELDAAIGELLAQLDALGLSENTLVIFTSDNGGRLEDASQAPLRGGKAQLYEGGLRVPLIARWPGTINTGTTTDALVSSADLFATILAVTGTRIPTDEPRDGMNLLPLLRGETVSPARPLFWHYPHYHTAGIHGPASAIRQGDWKLIHYYEHALAGHGIADELFNLRADPGESRNLIRDEPARAAELLAVLQQHLLEAGAQLPTVNDDFDPARAKQLNR